MSANSPAAPLSNKRLWAGRILGGLATLFFLVDALAKFAKPQAVVEGTVSLGYSESIIVPLGVILLVCTLLYAVPRTAVLGAVLLTGYLGGAVATHARVGDPLFSHTLFPVYFGVLVWAGLWLRDDGLRRLLPLRD